MSKGKREKQSEWMLGNRKQWRNRGTINNKMKIINNNKIKNQKEVE